MFAANLIPDQNANSAPSFTLAVDLTSEPGDLLQFDKDEQFAIVLRAPGGGAGFRWWAENSELPGANPDYLGGSLYYPFLPDVIFDEGGDAQFRTYMLIPEPATLALATCGLLGLTAIRRHLLRR